MRPTRDASSNVWLRGARRRTGAPQLLFRPHPRDREWRERFAPALAAPDVAVQEPSYTDLETLATLLQHGDCVVANAGTILLDALVNDRPAVCVLYDEGAPPGESWALKNVVGEHYRELIESGAFLRADRFEDVVVRHPALPRSAGRARRGAAAGRPGRRRRRRRSRRRACRRGDRGRDRGVRAVHPWRLAQTARATRRALAKAPVPERWAREAVKTQLRLAAGRVGRETVVVQVKVDRFDVDRLLDLVARVPAPRDLRRPPVLLRSARGPIRSSSTAAATSGCPCSSSRRSIPNARVLAFEPRSERTGSSCATSRRTAERSVEVHQAALGRERQAQVQFFEDPDDPATFRMSTRPERIPGPATSSSAACASRNS